MRIILLFLFILAFNNLFKQSIQAFSFLKSYDFYMAANSEDEFDDEEGSEEEQENEEIEENA